MASLSRACAAALWLLAGATAARTAEPLTMDAALARIVEHHPSLRALDLERAALDARRDAAVMRPPLLVTAEVEDVAGTGARSGVRSAQWTLGIEGVLERGGKRTLRGLLAASRIDAQAPRRAAAALDLLAEGATRYLDVVAAEGDVVLAADEVRTRERWATLARERSQAGAIPTTSPLVAEAKAARARFERQRARQRRDVAWRRLAIQWGESDAAVGELAAQDPLALPEPPSLQALMALLERNPEIALLAAEERLRASQLRLAEAARAPDVTWHAGLRRHDDADDWALVAGVSVPLGSAARAAPEMRAARAELDALSAERDVAGVRLRGLLVEAHALYVAAYEEVRALRDDVLPRLGAAADAAERAWQAGALSPLENAELLDERLAARRTQLAAALSARRALIEIQRLTAEPLGLVPGDTR